MITLLLLFYIISKYNQVKPEENIESLPYDPHKLYRLNKQSQRKLLCKIYRSYCPKGFTIAFKGFKPNMTCRDFQYEEGKHYTLDGRPICCQRGFHACLFPKDCFNYYTSGYYHIVYVKDFVNPDFSCYDSKICAKEIIIGPRIYFE